MLGVSSVERQVFSGSCNTCESCYDVGGFNDNAFVAYACGTSVIVLRQANFERLQRIADVACTCSETAVQSNGPSDASESITHEPTCAINSGDAKGEISCIECSTVFGKIAVSCGSRVLIYEPQFACESVVSGSVRRTTRATKLDVASSTRLEGDPEYVDPPHAVPVKYSWRKKAVLAVDQDINIDVDGEDDRTTQASQSSGTNLYRAGAPFATARRVVVLAFNFNGSRLLAGTRDGSLFYFNLMLPTSSAKSADTENTSRECEWRCIWQLAHPDRAPFTLAHFSPDSAYFCTVNSAQRSVVGVWFGVRMHAQASNSGARTRMRFQQFTLAHPEPVVCVQWRNFNGTLVPIGAVQNVLLTITADNVCRVWSENQSLYTLNGIGPRDIDSLVDRYCDKLTTFLTQFSHYVAAHCCAPPRLVQRTLDAMILRKVGIKSERCLDRICAALRFDVSSVKPQAQQLLPMKVTSRSRANANTPKHARSYFEGYNAEDIAVGMCHFHLVASVNANTDIALLSAGVTRQASNGDVEPELSTDGSRTPANLILNFLNNKETLFNAVLEKLFRSLNTMLGEDDEHARGASGEMDPSPAEDEDEDDQEKAERARNVRASVRHAVLNLLDGWHTAADLLVAFSPADGSLLMWTLEHLDPAYPACFASQLPLVSAPRSSANNAAPTAWSSAGELGAVHLRQAQVSFTNRLPALMPACDARALAARVRVTNDFAYLTRNALAANAFVAPADLVQCYLLVTQHRNASLNFWQFALAADTPRERDGTSRDRERTHVQQLPRLPFASYQIHSFQHRLRLTGHADPIRAVLFAGSHQLLITHSDLALEFWRFYPPPTPGRPRKRTRFAPAQLTHIASVKNRLIADTRKRFALLPCALTAAQCFDATSMPLPAADDPESLQNSVMLMLSFEERERPAESVACASMKKLRFYALVLDARWLLDADRLHAQLAAQCPMLSEPSGSHPASVFLLRSALVDADFSLDELVFMHIYRFDQLLSSDGTAPPAVQRHSTNTTPTAASVPTSLFDSAFCLVMLTRRGRLAAYTIHVSNRRHMEARALLAGRNRKTGKFGHTDISEVDAEHGGEAESDSDVSFHVGPGPGPDEAEPAASNAAASHAQKDRASRTSTTTAIDASHQSRLLTVEVELTKLSDIQICDSSRRLVAATLAWNANSASNGLADSTLIASTLRQSAVEPYQFVVVDDAATVRCYALRLGVSGTTLECNELSQSITLNAHCAEAPPDSLSITAPFVGYLMVYCGADAVRASPRPNQLAFSNTREPDTSSSSNVHVFECLSSGGREWAAVHDEVVLSTLARTTLLAPALHHQVLTREQVLAIAGPRLRTSHRLFSDARFGICAPPLRAMVAVQKNEIHVFDIEPRTAAFADTIAFDSAALVDRAPLPVYHPDVLLHLCMLRDYVTLHAVLGCLQRALRRMSPDSSELRTVIAARFADKDAEFDADVTDNANAPTTLTKTDLEDMRRELARVELPSLSKQDQQELLSLLNAFDADELIERFSSQIAAMIPRAPQTAVPTTGPSKTADTTDSAALFASTNTNSNAYDALFDTPRFDALEDTLELKLDDLDLELDADEDKSQPEEAPEPPTSADGLAKLDECGQRFALVLRRALATNSNAELGATAFVIWAFHSESQRELLELIPGVRQGEVRWPELRRFGAGWWLKDSTLLRKVAEQLAACELQRNDADALDAAAYQLVLGRRALVVNWYKMMHNERMVAFWRQDFENDAGARRVALKNAYHLLSLQRPAHAIAFFLLVDAFQDALDIAVYKLADFQLALLLARLCDLNAEVRSKLTAKPIAGKYRSALAYLVTRFIIEPFEVLVQRQPEATLPVADTAVETLMRFEDNAVLASIAYWCVGQYTDSVRALVDALRTPSVRSAPDRVYHVYVYLKRHPLVQRQSSLTAKTTVSEADECYLQFQLLEQFTHQLGSPLLALLSCAEFERHATEWFGPASSATSRRYYEQMKTAVFLGYALQDLDTTFLQPYAYDILIGNGGSLCAPFDSWFSVHCRFATAIMPRADRTSLQLELLSHVLRYCISRTDSDLQLASTAATNSPSLAAENEPRATCAQLEMAVRLAASAFLADLEARSMLLRRAEMSRVSGNSREREALNRLRSMAPRSSIAVALDPSSLSPRVLETGPKLVKYVVNLGTGASATVSLGSPLVEGDYLDHLDTLRHELLRAFTVFSLAVSNAESPRLRASVRLQATHIGKLSEALSRCIFEALQLVTPSSPHPLAPAAAVIAAAARGFVPLEGSNGLSLQRSAAVKWPGVAALRAMLLLKEQTPRTGAHGSHTFGEPQSNFARKFSRILMFLCECFTLLYVVRISTAVWLLDARRIQRTLPRELDEACFFSIFGGAVSLQQGTPTTAQPPALQSPQSPLARTTISSFDLPRSANSSTPDAPNRDQSPSGRRGAPVRPPPITKQPIAGAPGFSSSSNTPAPSAPAQLTSAKTTTGLAGQSPPAAAQPPPSLAGANRRDSLRAGGQPHEFFVAPTCSFNEFFSQKHRSASRLPIAQSNTSSTGGNSNMTSEEQYYSDSEAAERFRTTAQQHTADLYEDDEQLTTNECSNDNSFSWLMVQFLSFVVARSRMQNFLKKVLQLELEDLNELHAGSSQAQSSCSLYVLFMHLKQFERHAAYQLGVVYPDGPPASYYPVTAVNARIEQDRAAAAIPGQAGVNTAPPIQLRKYRLLASADFTPFQPTRCGGADPTRLWHAHVLWQTLLKQDSVGSLVSKLLCETRDAQPNTTGLPSTSSVTDLLAMLTSGAERERDEGGTPSTNSASSRYVVVYRTAGEQAIHAFSINEANLTQAVVASGDKDVIELDVSSVVCDLSILRKSSASFSLLRRNSDSHFSISALWDSFDDGSSIALRDLDTTPAHDSGAEEHDVEIYARKKLDDDTEHTDGKANGRRYDKKRLRNTRLHIPARRMHRDRDRHHAHRDRSHKSQANRGGTLSALQINKKQASSVVRCIVAHPQLPFYLTGTQDGNIQVQRFGMNERLSQLRPPNSLFPKVTKLEFTREGNRIGASDAEGAVSLWHLNVVGSAAANNQPYYSLKCHSKAAHDFTFLNSATVFATAGLASGTAAPGVAVLASSTASTTWNTLTANMSVLNGGNNMAAAGSYPQLSTTISTTNTDAHNYNVCIWDTLLHPRKALAYGVRLFDDESQNGAAVSPNANTLASDCHVLQHCPMHSLLFVGTRRGVLHCVDMRMFSECRNTVRSWYAHDAATGVKALAIDPQERCLVTGSASGEIKLWSITAINTGGTMKPLATIKRQAGTAGNDGFTIEAGDSVSLTSLPSGGANVHHSASAGVKNSITQLRIPAFEPNLLFASSATGTLSIFSLNKILETNEF